MTNQYLWDRLAGRDPKLRAADADRERIAERLRKGHAEGRLDMDEFQHRLERCLEARTFGAQRACQRPAPSRRSGRARLARVVSDLALAPGAVGSDLDRADRGLRGDRTRTQRLVAVDTGCVPSLEDELVAA